MTPDRDHWTTWLRDQRAALAAVTPPRWSHMTPGERLRVADVLANAGEWRLTVGHTGDRRVVLECGAPVTWLDFTPAEARHLAQLLVAHAEAAER
jgi:hypothetical protein